MNQVAGAERWWCNACVAWGDPVDDEEPSSPIAPPPGPAPSAPSADIAGWMFWMLDGLFIAAGLIALALGYTKVGVALIAFGVLGGVFLIF
jgi:hypothetical protein